MIRQPLSDQKIYSLIIIIKKNRVHFMMEDIQLPEQIVPVPFCPALDASNEKIVSFITRGGTEKDGGDGELERGLL